jgi:hypothetical protein
VDSLFGRELGPDDAAALGAFEQKIEVAGPELAELETRFPKYVEAFVLHEYMGLPEEDITALIKLDSASVLEHIRVVSAFLASRGQGGKHAV